MDDIEFFLRDLKASNYNLSFIESVENLIKENKELYKNYLKLKSEMEILSIAYIAKSKVKENIEELDNMKVDGEVFRTSVNFARKILQELLEEGE